MIRSMTGYGRGEAEASGERWMVEAKSVNHRYLDVRTKSPGELFGFDLEAQRAVQERFGRGRFEILISRESSTAGTTALRRDVMVQYLNELRELRNEFDFEGQITVDSVLGLPGVIDEKQAGVDESGLAVLRKALGAALDNLEAMRKREGESIEKDLRMRVERILSTATEVEGRVPALNAQLHDRLVGRLKDLVEGISLDAARVEQEVAFLVERSDVTEELVRLGIHTRQFLAFLEEKEPVGRKMDFLIQEMNREINTLGSKIGDAEVAQMVVLMKSELEKVREQVQNVE